MSVSHMRGRTSKFVTKRPRAVKDSHVFGIDGEVLFFSNFVKYEVEFEGLEVLVDFNHLMEGHFKN